MRGTMNPWEEPSPFQGVEEVSGTRSDRGNKRYGITIPSKLKEKGKELYGKEVIVIVILPDDEE
jgi:hypothetical protein